MEAYCEDNGILDNFSAPRTPEQNGIIERNNRSLVEAGRTILVKYTLPKHFWVEAVSITCYVINRTSIRKILNKTSNEL